jgi:hypothetical protein
MHVLQLILYGNYVVQKTLEVSCWPCCLCKGSKG